ncbi:helix-turn-helix domain-containing protein [Rhodobacterales bacterium]|nr:helix-turn-helix domain-containing protein [Rhodobacterales bacterium]
MGHQMLNEVLPRFLNRNIVFDSTRCTDSESTERSYHFDTKWMEKELQFDAHANELSYLCELCYKNIQSTRQGHRASKKGYNLGDIRVIDRIGEEMSFIKSKQDAIRLNLDDWVFMYAAYGGATVDGNGVRSTINSLNRLALITAEHPFNVHFADHEIVYFSVPRQRLGGLEGAMATLTSLPNGANRFHPMLTKYFGTLTAELPNMSESEAVLAGDATTAIIRAAIAPSKDNIAEAQPAIMATQFETAKRFIDDNLRSHDLNVQRVQAALRVSRRQLFKIFDKCDGVNGFIRSRRLHACYRELISDGVGRPIHQIAEDYGFTNPANFSRLFRREFGFTASDAREEIHSRPRVSTDSTHGLALRGYPPALPARLQGTDHTSGRTSSGQCRVGPACAWPAGATAPRS